MPILQRYLLLMTSKLIVVKVASLSLFQEIISISNVASCSFIHCYQKFQYLFNKINHIPVWKFAYKKCEIILDILLSGASKRNIDKSCIISLCQEKPYFHSIYIYGTASSVGNGGSSFSVVGYLSKMEYSDSRSLRYYLQSLLSFWAFGMLLTLLLLSEKLCYIH